MELQLYDGYVREKLDKSNLNLFGGVGWNGTNLGTKNLEHQRLHKKKNCLKEH